MINPGSECEVDEATVIAALRKLGSRPDHRGAVIEFLRSLHAAADDPDAFRDEVRWPLLVALLADSGAILTLEDGTRFHIGLESRIERAALLSTLAHPDHLWEPQTTKLLRLLASGGGDVVIGGAYVGDQAVPVATVLRTVGGGRVHAFEPMAVPYQRLCENVELNGLEDYVVAHRMGLWERSDVPLAVVGLQGLAYTEPAEEGAADAIRSVAIDDYVAASGIERLSVVMLDVEGGEQAILRGASVQLGRPDEDAPTIVFEVHRSYVDWTDGLASTEIVRYLTGFGYEVFAVRDFNDNVDLRGLPVELVPVDDVYLDGPPHGFNLVAVRGSALLDDPRVRVVHGVSPKLLRNRDPALHEPLDWQR